MPVKAKSTGILCGLRAFLLHNGTDKRLLEAFYHYGAPPNDGMFFLCRCVQHVFDENAIAGGGVVHKNMGDRANELAVLDDGAAGHECVNIGSTLFTFYPCFS